MPQFEGCITETLFFQRIILNATILSDEQTIKKKTGKTYFTSKKASQEHIASKRKAR